MFHDLRKRLPVLDDHVGEGNAREDAVALRDVATEGEAAALLAAEDRVGLRHLRTDVLEADLQLVALEVNSLTQLVDLRVGGQRATAIALFPSLSDQVLH